MSSQPTQNPSSGGPLLEQLAANGKQVALGLMVAGLVLGGLIAGVTFHLYKMGSMTTAVWGILVAVFLIAVGLVYLLVSTTETAPAPEKRANYLRMVLLGVSAGLGLLTAIYGIALALSEPPYAMLNYRTIFAGGIKAWRDPANNYENAWALIRCVGAVVVGLVLMFVGLHLARTFERTSQGLRRLLYGYNAVLSSLLIGFILLLLNVLSYSNVMPFKALGTTYDWTGARMYSLSESTENLLTSLKEPVTVYLLLSRSNPISIDAEALLNTCHQTSDLVNWESLSPEGNRSQVAELAEKYGLSNPRGMLVVYGREGSQTWDFTKQDDLQVPDPKHPGGLGYIFKGEEYLQKSLIYLTQNKTKTQVYFTQGHGEPETGSQNPDPARGGLGALADELRKRNYDVHDLKVGPGFKEVPRDADIVVIVDPREAYSAKEVTALRDYLQGKGPSGKKGHLMVLADVRVQDGHMMPTGLEKLLGEYGVQVQNDRLLQMGASRAEDLLFIVGNTSTQSNNPVARAFNPQGAAPINFGFEDVRPVDRAPGQAGAHVVDLLIVARNQVLMRQTNLSERPRDMLRDLSRKPAEFQNRLIVDPVPLAAAVSEGNPLSRIPGHEGMGGEGERPRLVVFGDATWVSNPFITRGRLGLNNADLFASCLAWLRERPDIGANVTTPERQYYQINMPPGSVRLRLLLLPIGLLLVAVLAMGLGVWVIRRR